MSRSLFFSFSISLSLVFSLFSLFAIFAISHSLFSSLSDSQLTLFKSGLVRPLTPKKAIEVAELMDDVIFRSKQTCPLVPGPQTFLSWNVQTAVTGTTLAAPCVPLRGVNYACI